MATITLHEIFDYSTLYDLCVSYWENSDDYVDSDIDPDFDTTIEDIEMIEVPAQYASKTANEVIGAIYDKELDAILDYIEPDNIDEMLEEEY
jgi:hypothetical protein